MSQSAHFDPNRRPDPLLHEASPLFREDDERLIPRVTRAAIPFLNMYRPLEVVTTTLFGGQKCWALARETVEAYREGHYIEGTKKSCHLAFTVASLVLTLYRPKSGMVLSLGGHLICNIKEGARALQAGETETATKLAGRSLSTLLYLASAVYQSPELLALSLTAQTITEAKGSIDEFKRGRVLEGIANLALALIRGYSASIQIKTAHREWFGRDLHPEEFNSLLAEIDEMRKEPGRGDQLIDFQELLAKGGYKSRLEGLDGSERDFTKIRFSALKIDSCNFSSSSFQGSLFDRVTILNSNFSDSNFIHSLFSNSTFDGSDFSGSRFNYASLLDSTVQSCNLGSVEFNDAQLSGVHIRECSLLETNFFRARAPDSILEECDLTDTLLLNAKADFTIRGGSPHRITRPVVGLLYDFRKPQSGMRFTNYTFRRLKEMDVIRLRFDAVPEAIDENLLKAEVAGLLEQISQESLAGESIPQALLRRAEPGSQIAALAAYTRDVLSHVDGVVLPGGMDIEPEFYGDTLRAPSELEPYPVGGGPADLIEPSPGRSISEYSIFDYAYAEKIPTWGICRNFQQMNVFFGGSLSQHVPGHKIVFQELKVHTNSAEGRRMQEIFGDSPEFYSSHHQGVKEVGEGLEVVFSYDSLPKGAIRGDAPMMGTQFHAELFLPENIEKPSSFHENNRGVFRFFLNWVEERRASLGKSSG